MKILVTPTSFPRTEASSAYRRLTAFSDEIVWNPHRRPLTPEEIRPLLSGVTGWIAGLDTIDGPLLRDAPPELAVISRYGVGVERVDLQTAQQKGIVVTNTPGTNAEAVADLAFGLMLSVARRIPVLNEQVRAGGWPRTSGVELFGKTLGLIGLGAIGKNVARRAAGFSMRILAYDPFVDEAYCRDNGIVPVPLDVLLAQADVVSLHLPLTPGTRHLLDRGRVFGMKKGAILINTSRGGLVDEVALADALREDRLHGVGLDAFAVEPPGTHPLFAFEHVVATPHAGAHTREAAERMADMSVENLIAVLEGKPCAHLVTAGVTNV